MRLFPCGLALSLALSVALPAEAGPMRDLARLVPAGAEAPVLALPGPLRRELLRFAPDLGAEPLAPWVLGSGFPYWSIKYWAEPIQTGGGAEYFGAPFDVIEGIASWGEPPKATGAMLLRDAADGVAIAGFLDRRGFQQREVNGVSVYWLDEQDERIDFSRRNRDLFVGDMGMAARVALKDRALFAAHGWPRIEAALAPGDGLLDDGGRAGIIDAAEAAGSGIPAQIMFIGPQRPRLRDPAVILGADPQLAAFNATLSALPPIPYFQDSALVLWLDGGHLLSGVALFYSTPEGAGAALPWLVALKDSPLAGVEIWADLLGAATARAVDVGSGSVLLWAVPNEIDPSAGIKALSRAPVAFRTFLKLHFVGQLAAVLGG